MPDLHAAVREYLAALDVSRKPIVPQYGKAGGLDHKDISQARARRLYAAEQALREATKDD